MVRRGTAGARRTGGRPGGPARSRRAPHGRARRRRPAGSPAPPAPDELDPAGRAAVAEQVRQLRSMGVDAWAWLPTSKGTADLAEYAERQGATLVLVPRELEQPSLVDKVV